MAARLKNRHAGAHPRTDRSGSVPVHLDVMDGMADSIAREALTSHSSFKRSQRRIAKHLVGAARKMTRGFTPAGVERKPMKRPKHQNGAMGRGGSRGY